MNEEKMVPDSELAAIVRDVQPEEGFEFHRVEMEYRDGIPRAVFIGPDDEPTSIPMTSDIKPLRFLVGRLAADLAAARGGIELVYLANKGLGEEVATLRTENAKSAAALAHARDAAHGLYQATSRFLRSWDTNEPPLLIDRDIEALRRAIDPAEADASAKETARRDGLDREVESLRRRLDIAAQERSIAVQEAASLRAEVAAVRAAFAAEVESHKTTLNDRDAARAEVARLRAPLPEVDAEELWTDYKGYRGAGRWLDERPSFFAGVEAGRRHPTPLPQVELNVLWDGYRAKGHKATNGEYEAFRAGVSLGRRTRAPQSAPDASERPNRMNKSAYAQLIAENIAWCEAQPRTLERDHTIMVLRESVDAHYPPSGQPMPSTPDASLKERAEGALRAWRNNGSISDVVDLSSWLAVVRYVDASRPGLNEEEARPDDRVSMDSELARAVRDTLGETTHYGVMERIEELLDVEKESASRGDVPAEVRAVSPTDRPTDAANGSAIMEAAVVLGEEPPTQPPRREQIEALCKEAILDTGKGMHGHAIGCLVKAIRHMNEAP